MIILNDGPYSNLEINLDEFYLCSIKDKNGLIYDIISDQNTNWLVNDKLVAPTSYLLFYSRTNGLGLSSKVTRKVVILPEEVVTFFAAYSKLILS